MEEVIVSRKYQVVIPKRMRESMRIRPGDKFRIFLSNDCLELLPVRKIKSMRGFLNGIGVDVKRDADRT